MGEQWRGTLFMEKNEPKIEIGLNMPRQNS